MAHAIRVALCESCGSSFVNGKRGPIARRCADCIARERTAIRTVAVAGKSEWICPCGSHFTPHPHARHRKWCSDACRVRHERDRTPEGRRRRADQAAERNRRRRMETGTPIEIRSCVECSALFVVNMSTARRARMVCSRTCSIRRDAKVARSKPDFHAKKNAHQTAQRAEAKAVPRFVCIVCDERFGSTKPTAKYCSVACEGFAKTVTYAGRPASRRMLAKNKIERAARGSTSGRRWANGPCMGCGTIFTGLMCSPDHVPKWCSLKCPGRPRKHKRTKRPKITPAQRRRVFERDGWMCRICGDPVSRDAVFPALDAPVIDHIIPFSLHGPHNESNWQTAHNYCNNVKQAEVGFEFVA